MKLYFNDKEQELVDILRDRQWHCVWSEAKMKDDRARLSAINKKLKTRGWEVKSEPCTIHNHESRILMRKIVKLESSPLEAMETFWNQI